MVMIAKPALSARRVGHADNNRPREKPKPGSGEDTEEEDGLELPVNPDEGTPLIPDDERVVNVPS
ncbi:hypothetical protein LP414_02905 [Polaromonas sp. P1(28)-13]|jgi:hypothetical protein|nr:hypothetical protein LP414_02905 [Polaromonas sp. P1(28)-13]